MSSDSRQHLEEYRRAFKTPNNNNPQHPIVGLWAVIVPLCSTSYPSQTSGMFAERRKLQLNLVESQSVTVIQTAAEQFSASRQYCHG